MKIDRSKLKKSSSEVPADCKALIDRLKSCSHDELLSELTKIKTWNCGKCELYHWIDVLDMFDSILEEACQKTTENQWCLPCDMIGHEKHKELLLQTLQFTALLIEHSFSRHFYNSMEHLTTLLSSSDMQVVLGVLNLLYVFSKRSNFISRLNSERRQVLLVRLTYLAESWGGKENGFGLAECCEDVPVSTFPSSATTLHFEFYLENSDDKTPRKSSNAVCCIHIDNVDQIPDKNPSQIMESLVEKYSVPEDKQMLLFTHVRLAHSFSNYTKRLQCVQARLQALSVLVYCNAIPDNANTLLYNGLIEELVDVLELQDPHLIEIKAASLRTLTSVIHLEKNPRLNVIIDSTGASSYHGFLPVLVRNCIQSLTEPDAEPFPLPFATALFSFLYHLASYESGGEALVSCGMMEALLKVINWHGTEPEHITFVTRAVRVIDLITNLDMQAFQSHGGLNSFIQRLEMEIDTCRLDQPYVIKPKQREASNSSSDYPASYTSSNTNAQASSHGDSQTPMEVDSSLLDSSNSSTETRAPAESEVERDSSNEEVSLPESVSASSSSFTAVQAPDAEKEFEPKKGVQCFPQRAALLKSMLNFLKKAIQDPAFSDNIRHLMDGSLPRSLKHVISNSEYYGPSLFLLATDVVTVYVFQEPSLLSSLQDNGLTDVVLHALLVKEVPATREVLASLPNVFSALCLNTRGLQSFVACKPFEKLFRVLVSPDYLPAMRRRRSSDPLNDTASNLGNAMDELMRHQPSLRTDATAAIIKLLEELCAMGRDPRYVCSRPTTKTETTVTTTTTRNNNVANEAGSSDEEEEEDEETGGNPVQGSLAKASSERCATSEANGLESKTPVPLVDYILNVMRFVDAILSNNSTDDHCREFVRQKGLIPLMAILGLPNLPVDFPVTQTCQAVASVCKSILNLAHEPQVLRQGLLHLNEVLQSLEPLHKPLESPGGSVLLEELISAPNLNDAVLSASSTPLLHSMAAAHAYIIMFVHVCRTGQSDIRTISISHWGSELGLSVLKGLSSLYTSLVWESTVLLALCSDNALPADCQFGRQQLEKLLPKDLSKLEKQDDSASGITHAVGEFGSNGVTSAMEALTTNGSASTMDVDDVGQVEGCASGSEKGKSKQLQMQIKQIKPLLSGASRLGRALAELFGLLVKLCVGSPIRQRRGQQIPPSPSVPSPAARAVASALTRLLATGLSWEPPPTSPVPKFRLTFYICSVGFTSPMLFDERKYPYHLMLHKFLSCGGQDAFFETFRWALTCGGKVPIEEGLEHPDLPDGTGEFLDAWLMLLEKMVNPKTVLESPHTLPAKFTQPGCINFNPVLYLIHTHKLAFEAIMHLWDREPLKVYGDRMSESMLAILCHLLRGETIIKEKLAKIEDVPAGATAATTAAGSASGAESSTSATAANRTRRAAESSDEGGVNPQHLVQLVDMGFSRALATEALLHTSSVEQATEYLLSYPPPLGRNSTSGTLSMGLGMDWDMSEEDQMLRAIAMSLGENVLVSTNQEGEEEQRKTEEQKEPEKEQQQEDPLSSQVIDDFTKTMLPGCLRLLDTLPDTVYRACDLLVAVVARNGSAWRDNMLEQLLQEVRDNIMVLLSCLKKPVRDAKEPVPNLSSIPEANRAAVRLHLFTLLFEEMRIPCVTLVEEHDLIRPLIKLLVTALDCLITQRDVPTPKWMAPLILLIDMYEKAAVSSRRKAPLLQAPRRQWKWFDDRNGKWNSYTAANNKTIDDAYKAGEQSVRFTAGRRHYTVQLSTMVQINEETGNWRPIMLTTDSKEEKEKDKEKKEDNRAKEKSMEMDESSSVSPPPVVQESNDTTSQESPSAAESAAAIVEEQPSPPQAVELKVVKGLSQEQCVLLVKMCVGLISIPVEPDTLHAVMRLCLRLTRNHSNAVLFAQLGGPKMLLTLTQSSAFIGFTSLATLLFRHVLEDALTLQHTMEKVIRSSTLGSNSLFVSREMHYVLRVLGPAACRDPELFSETAKNILRIALLPMSKREDEDNRYPNTYTMQMLKSLPAKTTAVTNFDNSVTSIIRDLLNALTTKPIEVPEETNTTGEPSAETTNQGPSSGLLRDTSANDLLQQDEDDGGVSNVDANGDSSEPLSSARDSGKSNKDIGKDGKVDDSIKKKTPLLPKSAVCRLLAELVRSYAGCARLIAEYTYPAGQSELITEDCAALAFILDNLLHQCQTAGDKDTPALARVLIAAIASCNHSPDAQNILVNEVKAALHRALVLPESSEKHARVQALTGLVSTMIESCPSASSQNQLGGSALRHQQTSMNNIVRTLLRRGVVTDLARIPHHLDLSSPHMATTVNSALKPLETLSRIVNLPAGQLAGKNTPKGKSTTSNTTTRDSAPEAMEEDPNAHSEVSIIQTNEISTAEATTAYEATADDSAENTDSEAPDVANATHASESQVQDIVAEAEELEGIMDELLDRHGAHSEDQILGEALIVGSGPRGAASEQELVISVDMDDHHDSQMISQHESEFDEDHTQGDDDHQESSDSDSNSESGHSHSEDEAERDDEHEDEGDEAEDEEEEDDESSHFGMDDYQDIENALFHVQDREDSLFFQLEEVFPSSSGSSIVFGGSDGIRTFQIPVVTDDTTNGTETAAPTVPPAPRNVSTTHPLLVRHGDVQSNVPTRVHRRQRGYRPALSNHTWHMYTSGSRHPNPPAILQRLLGPNTAQDFLQLTSSFSSHQPAAQTRVVFANSDFRILATEDDVFEVPDQSAILAGDGTGTLSSIPSALVRWTEECRVLDGDSVHDCVAGLKPGIIEVLEKYRDEELAERKEKRRKLQEEEEAKKKEKEKSQPDSETTNITSSDQASSEVSSERTGTVAMEVAEPASQFESNISATSNVPTFSSSADVSGQDATSLSTERLAASIVEQVLGPALAITSASSSPSVPTTISESLPVSASTLQNPALLMENSTSLVTEGVAPTTSEQSEFNQAQTPASVTSTFPSNWRLVSSVPVVSSLSDSFSNVSTPMDTSEPEPHQLLSSSELLQMSQFLTQDLSFNPDVLSSTQMEAESGILSQVSDSGTITASRTTSVSEDQASAITPEDLSTVTNTSSEGIVPCSLASSASNEVASLSVTQTEVATVEQNSTNQNIPAETSSSSPEVASSSVTTEPAGPSVSTANTQDFTNILGADVEIPEGVDPSFLAALPENIRQEVIAEQLRLQRLRQSAQAARSQATSEGASFTEVNPEFLAALPPNIQEEVLAQQRAEQQRLAAQNSNPDTPVDPASFIQTLPQGLRQQVLADMDDSLLALLPPELAAEAHALRRELEARHRQIQERFFSSHAGTALSRILRSAGRVGTRYTIHTLPHRGQWTWNTLSSRTGGGTSGAGTSAATSSSVANSVRLRGRQLLDHEALACLLVLLFVDEPKLNTGRLHRVLRNLCHHSPTRQWVVKSLLSILERTKDSRLPEVTSDTQLRSKKITKSVSGADTPTGSSRSDPPNRGQPSWLSISLDAALGCRTNVFQIHRLSTSQRRYNERHPSYSQSMYSGNAAVVTIHPQASPVVCRHVLDTLISLAKSFPVHFLPEKSKDEKSRDSAPVSDAKPARIPQTPVKSDNKQSTPISASAKPDSSPGLLRHDNDFWDILVKLDSLSSNRKGKSVMRIHGLSATSCGATIDEDSRPSGFEASPLAQLISLLAHPVVRRSSVLTDRLLRLLALISLALPDHEAHQNQPSAQGAEVQSSNRETTGLLARATEAPSCIRDESQVPTDSLTSGTKKSSEASLYSKDDSEEQENRTVKQHLKLAIEVLTSKTCSEEGLEDATSLLLRLSRGCSRTRQTVVYLLLDGARQLGQVVCQHIRSLIAELQHLNAQLAASKSSDLEDKDAESDTKHQVKGTIQDRFTSTTVVITAPSKIKGGGGRELQLPSMAALTSKTSSQAFFLRVLKVIIQLREAAKLHQKKQRQLASDQLARNTVSQSSQRVDTPSATPAENPSVTVTAPSQGEETSSDANQPASLPMEVDVSNVPTTSQPPKAENPDEEVSLPRLSTQLALDELWEALSDCLLELAETPDHHAVLVLQPAVEAFFLVHASAAEKDGTKRREYRRESQESQMSHINQEMAPLSPLAASQENTVNQAIVTIGRESSAPNTITALTPDTVKFLKFAETHRTVLNQILRQSTTPLADGPFGVLVDHTRVLDFDVKRRYFRQELERMDEGARREDLAVHVRREHVFEDSFRELHRRTPEEWKNRFYIVFEGEEGQDAGGLLREWYTIISREIFNPMYALFCTSPGDRVTYMINSSSHCNSNHLSYFKFVGRVIAKAVYDNKLLESYFTRSFYKHILGKSVKYTDMESEDYSFYGGLVFLLEHDVKELGYELTFSVEVQEFGVTEIRDLKPNGRNMPVTEENKHEYVRLVCQEKMTGAIRKQLGAFLEGFYEIIPKRLISIFNEQELELLISGLPNIDIDDLKANTEYHKYQPTSLQIQWFWRALRSFDQADRANFLQFVTGTSKVPLQGFGALEGMNGTQKFQIHRDDRSTDRLPSAHTCFNQLDLPAYETYDKLRSMLLKAIHECSEGFGFA